MDYKTLDDDSIIHLIAHTVPEALSELYDRYSRLVYSLAIYTVGDPAVAEEVTQDVFIRVWQKAGTYRVEQSKVSTWICSIARNRSIDVLRKLKVRPEGHSIGWDDLSPSITPSTDGRDIEDVAHRSIADEQVRRAIASLPYEQQQALVLAFFHGLTHTEISVELKQPLGTVKTRIRMAMQKLRQLLEEPTGH